MKKFRKKPVVIQAEKWLGKAKQKERLLANGVIIDIPSLDGSCLIPTLEGNMTCQLNDYIIKGVKGEYYPCKPDIFELTYDVVKEEATLEVKSLSDEPISNNPESVSEGVAEEPIKQFVPVVEKKNAAKE